MHRIDGAGHVDHMFVAEDPATNRPPTEFTPDWFNATQEELATFIEWAGFILDKNDNSQLKQALLAKFLASTTLTTSGVSGEFQLTPDPEISAYVAGQRYRVKFHAAGSGADVINISEIGNKVLKQYDSTGTKVGAVISAGQLTDIAYDGADFIIVDALPASTGNTPPQFNNDLSLVTSEFVQRALGNARGLNSANASTTLQLSDVGKVFTFYGSTAGQILTFPALASIPSGAGFWIVNQGSVSVQVKGDGAEVINVNTLSGAAQSNALTIGPGDSIFFSSNNLNAWNAFGWASNNQFPKSLTASGWMKLPGGLIIQWGSVTTTSGSGTFTYPISFPNAVLSVQLTDKGADVGSADIFCANSAPGLTSVTVNSATNAGAAVSTAAFIVVIGW